MNMQETAQTPVATATFDPAHVDQLTALTFAMTGAQVFLKAMHPTERHRFMKQPENILRVVFAQFTRQLAGSDEGAKALVEEMKRRGF